MNTELATSLTNAINAAHSECVNLDDHIRDLLLAKVNKARQCGLLLMEFKEHCGHGSFAKRFSDERTFAFTLRCAQNYMAFARANPDEITNLADGIGSLYDAMIASGAIAPPLGHASQSRSSLSWIDRFGSAVMRAFGYFNGQIEKLETSVETLPPDDKRALKDRLQPLVDIHAKL